MAKTIEERNGNNGNNEKNEKNGKNGRNKREKGKKGRKGSSLYFQQCIKNQIDEAEQAQLDLIERLYEEKQQKTAKIREMLTEKESFIEQLQGELAELRREQLRITKEIVQFEAEKKAVEEKAQKDIEALTQEASKHRIFLSTFPAMPIGCDFEILTLPDFADLRLDILEKNYLIIGSAVFFVNTFSKEIIVLSGQLKAHYANYRIISVDQSKNIPLNISELIKKKLKADKIRLPKKIMPKLISCISRPAFGHQQRISLQLIHWLMNETKRQLISNHLKIIGSLNIKRKTLAEEILYQHRQLLKTEIAAKTEDERRRIFDRRKKLLQMIYKTAGTKKPLPQKPVKCGWFRKTIFRLFSWGAPESARQEMTDLTHCLQKSAFLQKNVSPTVIKAPAEKLETLDFIKFQLTTLKNRQKEIQKKLSAVLNDQSLKQQAAGIQVKIRQKQLQIFALKQEQLQLADQLENINAQSLHESDEVKSAAQHLVSLKLANAPPLETELGVPAEILSKSQLILEQSKQMLCQFTSGR